MELQEWLSARCHAMSNYPDGLNVEQRAAVLAPLCCRLVSAGAGSGKTRTLTSRVAQLIASGADPSRLRTRLPAKCSIVSRDCPACASLTPGGHLSRDREQQDSAKVRLPRLGYPSQYAIRDERDAHQAAIANQPVKAG